VAVVAAILGVALLAEVFWISFISASSVCMVLLKFYQTMGV
jgi:hypothetical protein